MGVSGHAPSLPAIPSPAADRRLVDLTFVVVDTETTGTAHRAGDRLTEFAAVVVRGGQQASHYTTLLNPERPIPRYITRLTGIDGAMVRDAPRFRDVRAQVRHLFDDACVFVAHNAPFDWGFVNMELDRAGDRPLSNDRLCTVRLARRLLSDLPRRSLDHVTTYYGIRVEGRHRALGDAMATAQVLGRLLDEAYVRGCDTWGDLDRLLHPGRARRPGS
jgi:DNA polymerase-3 subunit epsilon